MSVRRWVTAILCGAGLAVAGQAALAAGAGELSAEQQARIDAVFADYTSSTPGCALGVMRNGAMLYSHGYGMADLERKLPITAASVFDIGSVSKQFTAASVVLLAQDGKLSLDDDVRKYVPELPDFGTPVTINHLIWHTSGWRDYIALQTLGGIQLDQASDDAQTLAILARQKQLNFAPGLRWEYSNTGYFLLAVIVERVAGEPLAAFAAKRIFAPLGMTSTLIRNHYAMLIPNRALGYAADEQQQGKFNLSFSNWEQTGDGAVQISVQDMLKWDENYYQPKVGGRSFVEEMHRVGHRNDSKPVGYARGLSIDKYRGLQRVQHGGSWIGYRAMYERFPEQHTSIALFCNSDDAKPTPLAERVADIVLAGVFTEKSVAEQAAATQAKQAGKSGKPADHGRFIGSYFDADSNSVFSIVAAEGALALQAMGATLPLAATGPSQFAIPEFGATVGFTGKGQQPAEQLTLSFGEEPIRATRFVPAQPGAGELPSYAGTFYSSELDVAWPVVMLEGKLAIRMPTRKFESELEPLTPAMADAFTSKGHFLRFTRDASGAVTGFDLSTSRMKDIRFDLQR